MKRILILLVILIALSGIAYVVTQKDSGNGSTAKNDRDFKIQDINEIYKIKIKSRRLPELHLSRSGKDWMINYKHLARENSVVRLLEIMKNMRMQYIPHPNALPNIKDEMELLGIDVEIFDKNDNLLKSYVVGASTADERGTYFQMKGSKQPYVMEMASFAGSLRGQFYLDAEDWRDRYFLREDTDKIKKVTVEYPKSKDDSFILNVEENTVEPLNNFSIQKKITPQAGKMLAYLKGFEKVAMEAFETNYPKRDSISELIPFVKFTIENTDNTTKELKLYPIRDLKFYNINTTSIEETDKVERYLVDCSWGDFIMVQQQIIMKLLRPIDFFYN